MDILELTVKSERGS